MSSIEKDKGSQFGQLAVAIAAGLIALGLTGYAIFWGHSLTALDHRRYPLPQTQCAASKTCEQKDLAVAIRAAAIAETANLFSLYQLAVSIFGIGGLGITFFYAHSAWREARRSADTAEKALTNLERPFLVMGIRETGIEFLEDGSRRYGVTKYRFKNYGRTPAILMGHHFILESPKNGVPPPVECPHENERHIVHGMVIGPGEKSGVHETSRALSLISAFAAMKQGRDVGGPREYLLGYVRYRDLGGNEYVTGFCYFMETDSFGLASPKSPDGIDHYNYDRRLKP